MSAVELDAKTTALVLIDLQNGMIGRATAPYSVDQVVKQGADLAVRLRAAHAHIVYVRVDMADFLQLAVDAPSPLNAASPPASASELMPQAGRQSTELLITKRHWSAFAGTNLEKELRTRGVKTIVLAGIATNIGVESTAREAAGLGFNLVFAEDAMTSIGAEAHRFAVETIFPRIGRVRPCHEISVRAT